MIMTRSPTHNPRIHRCSVLDGVLTEVVPVVVCSVQLGGVNVLPLICNPLFAAIHSEISNIDSFSMHSNISKNDFLSILCNSSVGHSSLNPSLGLL